MNTIEYRAGQDKDNRENPVPVVYTERDLQSLEVEVNALKLRLEMLQEVGFGQKKLDHFKQRYLQQADQIVPINDYRYAVNVALYRKKYVNPHINRPNRRVYQRARARDLFRMDSWVAKHFAAGKATKVIKDQDHKEKIIPYPLTELIEEDSQRLETLEREWWRGRTRLRQGLWLTRTIEPLDKPALAVLTS